MTAPRLKVALAASLALNLFVIGAVAGALGMQARLSQKAPQSSARGSASALMRAAEVLPEAKREAYIARLKREGELAQKDYEAARAARVRASDMIAAPTYDQPAIAALLAKARNHDVTARTRFETAVIEFAGSLTPQERKVLGERLKPGYRPPQPAGAAQTPSSQPPSAQTPAAPAPRP